MQKGFATINVIIAAIAIIFVFGIISYSMLSKHTNSQQVTQNITPQTTSSHNSPSPTYQTTANNTQIPAWKTYTDTTYYYTVKYPANWQAQTGQNSNYPGLVTFTPPNIGPQGEGSINIWPRTVWPAAKPGTHVFTTLPDFMNSTDPEVGVPESKVYKLEDQTTIAGQEAMITWGGSAMDVGRHTLFIKNGVLYTITLKIFEKPLLNEDVYTTVLATFSFSK